MPKVLISDKLSEKGIQILKDSGLAVDFKTGLSPEGLRKIIKEYDALIIRSGTQVTQDIIADSQLKAIGRAGIGVDNIDVEAATKKGIVVMNTPSGNAVTTAEHAIAMMFAVSRQIPQATASLRSGKWEKKKFLGQELCNKVLGIVGLGNIGRIVADRALGLKMKVIAYDPFLSKEAAERLGVELVELTDLFKRADYITVHTPLNEKTRNLINKESFKKMKKGVFLINCARGGIVNETDLVSALEEGTVRGAALDVFEQEPPAPDNPILKLESVIFTPHIGAATGEAQEAVSQEIATMIADYFVSGTIRHAVNYPSISGEVLKFLGPYIRLGERLGSLQGQLLDRLPQEVSIEYRGEINSYNLTAITQAILKGLLGGSVSEVTVNYVNAAYVAKERGLKVVESKVSGDKDYASLLSITVKHPKFVRSISGTIFGKTHPRIVQIDKFHLEAVPEGTVLVMLNKDKPGVVGSVGSLLGKRKVNISRMQLGLDKEKGEAIALYNVDGDISPSLIAEIEKLPNILSVRKVVL